MTRSLAPVALALLLSAVASAQPATPSRLHGEADAVRTRKRLTEAQQKLTDNKPAEAADDLQKILDESGDDLVLVKDNTYQPARRLVHQYLAALPPATLATFRDRIDAPARKLLAAGRTARDPNPLRELIDRYYVSRPAEDALLLLGELAFERADFPAAVRYWGQLLPDDAAADLKYPEPKGDPAGVRAKVLLARIYSGDGGRAKADLDKFRTAHPKAAGALAGVNGVYADTLAKLLDAPPNIPSDRTGWTTFGGNPTRDGRSAATLPRVWPSRPTWKTPIPRDKADKDIPRPASVPPAKAYAFHPVALNGFAYLADAGRVFRFDLKTGTARLAFHSATLADPPDIEAKDLALPCLLDADFTLTAGNGKLFARLGPPALPTSDQWKKPRTYLVALAPKDERNLPPDALTTLNAVWQVAPPVGDTVYAAWEGAPVYADGRVYAAFVRVENSRFVHAIACYPETAATTPLWVTDVCDTDANRSGAKSRHEVLTLAGPNLVFAAHTGVTVAVNAASGKPAWAFRNPPAARPPVRSPRDLCPPVYADGTVFLAPADGEGVYALDAETGRKLWADDGEGRGLQVEHLLGVSRGKLIVTLHGPNKGVRGYSVATGSTRHPDGWRQDDDPLLGNGGRGLVADNFIVWPTAHPLYVLGTDDGRPRFRLEEAPHGNFAFADGVGLVATDKTLWGYVFDRDDNPPAAEPKAGPIIGTKPTPFDAKDVVSPPASTLDPVAAPALTAPAVVAREVNLPPGAWPLLPVGGPSETWFALSDGKKLLVRDLSNGEAVGEVPLDPGTQLTRATFAADGRVFAFGPHDVVAVDKGVRKLWAYSVPELDPRPELSSPTFVGSRVVMRFGDRGLIALESGTGAVAWVRDNFNRPWRDSGLDSTPRFSPHLAAFGRLAVVQCGAECRHLDAESGDVRRTEPTADVDWACPPTAFGKNRMLTPDAQGGLKAASGGRDEWAFDPGRPASRTGRPPATRVYGDDLLVSVSRNFGTELVRLNGAGAGVWREPFLLPASEFDLARGDADRERFYIPAENKLYAVNRDTGRREWAASLPELPTGGRWRVRVGRRSLIAYPSEPLWVEPVFGTGERVAAFPTPTRLVGGLLTLFDWWANRTLPVLLLDPHTGRTEQRLDVPVVGPTVLVSLHAETAVVASTGKAVWLKTK